jgi:hypothetical protein
MTAVNAGSGEALLNLLALNVDNVLIQAALHDLAHGMQPELALDNEDGAYVDWVTVYEIGLEFGFQDNAFVCALDPSLRHKSPPILTQLYFYGDTAKTRPFPYVLPFGLNFGDDRGAVRRKLTGPTHPCRAFIRDAWRLPTFDVTVGYRSDDGLLESVYCHVPYTNWPMPEGEAKLVAPFTPEVFSELFGQRWSSAYLRERLAPLGFHELLAQARSEHCADMRLTHGVEFGFGPGHEVAAADPMFPRSLALASVTYYAGRVLDAHEWAGPLPMRLAFVDSQFDIAAKIGRNPDARNDFDRTGTAVWHFERYSLRVEYSNIENRLMRVSLLAPGYWEASGGGGDEDHE